MLEAVLTCRDTHVLVGAHVVLTSARQLWWDVTATFQWMDSSSAAQICGGGITLSSSFCVKSIVYSSAFGAAKYCRVIAMKSMPKMINI